MKFDIVIGAGYGDEGKGQMVHTLALPNSCVVRFNGGAQCSHTVITPTEQYVFSLLGSGTFKRASTYLDQHCLVDPTIMNIEHGNFIQGPVWHIHKDCKITTPMDKLINRLCEKHRRITSSHHGSCGMGIFETVDRSANRTPLYAKDAFSQSLMDLLYCIYNEGIEVLTERGMPQYILREYVHYFETRVINNFCLEFQTLLTESVIVDSFLDLTQHYDHFVFEGGQGLRLHQDNIDEFPHVTPSCTGIDNIIPLLMHSTDINVHYMTRWYLTRHGAGSLQGEVPIDHPICLAAMHSHIRETNTANMYQGQFRYAPLNWNALMSAVNSDVIKYAQYNSTVNLNITHWDTAVASGLVNQAEYLSSLQSLNCAKRFLGFIDRTWVSF